MKASNKEKVLLYLVGIIFIGVIYYQFIYVKQIEVLNQKRKESEELQKRYDNILLNIKTLDQRKKEENIMLMEMVNRAYYFYPEISQEKLILEIDKLLITSGLKADIAFSPAEVAPIQYLTPKIEQKVESTLKPYVDNYSDEKVSEKTGTNINEATKATAEQFKVAINFSGTYKALKDFIESVEKYGRKISVTDLNIVPMNENDINGTLSLEFYAIPKLGDKDSEYLNWDINNIYGKESLFSAAAANGAYNSTVETLRQAEESNFVMLLKSPNSELPTLTLGKAKDSTRKTYITSDSDKVQKVEVEFVERGGKLYYKYNTSNERYPKDAASKGEEIILTSDKIIIEITSEARTGNNDKSGVNLMLKNDTQKVVEVIVKNDDSTNPRVTVTSEGNTVNVTKR